MAGTELESAVALTEKMENMTADEAVQIVRQLCARLEEDKTFHGCIWPGNIRLEDGKAVLGERSDVSAAQRDAEQVEFLAPEFFWSDAGSAAADVYSLGLLIYAACNGGYMPFQPKGGAVTEKDRASALRKRMKGERIPMPTGMSQELSAVVRRALAYKPEQRYASPAELLSALNQTMEALPVPEDDIIALSAEKPAPPKGKGGKKGGRAPEKKPGEKKPESGTEKPDEKPGDKPEDKPAKGEPGGKAGDGPEDKPEDKKPGEKPEDKPGEKAPEGPEDKKPGDGKDPDKKNGDNKKDAKDAPKGADARTAKKDGGKTPQKGGEKKGFTWDDEEDSPWRDAGRKDASRKDKDRDRDKAPARGQASGRERERSSRPETSPKSYTVQKDFDSRDRARKGGSAAPASRRKKKKKSSPLVAVLCLIAVAVIGVVVWRVLFPGNGDSQVSEPFTSGTGDALETISPDFVPDEESGAASEEAQQEETLTVVNDTVYAADSGVSLRVGPGTSYTVGQTLSRGTALQRTGVIGGWSQVLYEGTEYYVSSALVSVEDPLAAVTGPEDGETETAEGGDADIADRRDTVSITSDANLRSGPGTDYDVTATAPAGAVLQRTGEADGWSRVLYNGEEVFVSNKLIKAAPAADGSAGETETAEAAETPAATEAPAAETPAATAPPAPEGTETEDLGTVTITRKVNIRSGPGTDFSILGVAQVGESFTVTGFTPPKWYRVSYNGKQAFINDKYVDDSAANIDDDATVTVKVDEAVNIRSGPGAGYGVVGTAKAGETFTALRITDDHWYEIEYNGSTAYVSGKFVTQAD